MAKYDQPQSPFAASKRPHGGRCAETVPRSLYGPVGMPPRCSLNDAPDGPHGGEHRATFAIQGVGKVLFKWKVTPHLVSPKPHLKGRRLDKLV